MGIKLYENNLLKGSINLRVNAKQTLKELKKNKTITLMTPTN